MIKAEQKLINAGLKIVKDLGKEIPKSLNKQNRDLFRQKTSNQAVVQKEMLEFKNGSFSKHTNIQQIVDNGMLEDYLQANLEGTNSAQLGLITFDVGTFKLGIVRINPQTAGYEEDFFLLMNEDYLHLASPLNQSILNTLINKHASFVVNPPMTLGIKPVKMDLTPQQINEFINKGEGHFISLTEEQVKELGLKEGDGVKLDDVTRKRVEKNLIDGSNIEFKVEE